MLCSEFWVFILFRGKLNFLVMDDLSRFRGAGEAYVWALESNLGFGRRNRRPRGQPSTRSTTTDQHSPTGRINFKNPHCSAALSGDVRPVTIRWNLFFSSRVKDLLTRRFIGACTRAWSGGAGPLGWDFLHCFRARMSCYSSLIGRLATFLCYLV